jgi:preprotein translocase subunit SecA
MQCFHEREREYEEEGDSQEDLPEPLSSEHVTAPIRRATPKVGCNEPCPCGSGKKFKKCCGAA